MEILVNNNLEVTNMSEINLSNYEMRTDLAFEAIDMHDLKKSLEIKEDVYEINKMIIKRTIVSEQVAKETGKKSGLYYSLDTRAIKPHDHDDLVNCEKELTKIIKEVLKTEGINGKQKGLVVGLGNINVTPDSLGPLVVDNVIVTRHMFLIDPNSVSEGISEVSAISPGVMGTTGIDTVDIIDAIVNKIKVDYIICVDALASRSIARVNKTIQVTNTGISPGSGVGSKRKELSKETVGIPVIAIGVPTVVDAVTIAIDTASFVMKYLSKYIDNNNVIEKKIDFEKIREPKDIHKKQFLGDFGMLNDDAKRELIEEVLTPSGYNMMVTPKEVDLDISDLTEVISGAIDRALHTIVDSNA